MVDKSVEHDFILMSVVAVVAVIAMFSLISPASLGDTSITGNVIGEAITENSQSCADTDAGLDYSTKGRLSGDIPGGFYSEDRCFMHYFLREVYCKDNRAASHMIYCRGGCENGMCKEKKIQQKCGDGVLTGWERCDGANLRNRTCNDLGFIGGTLSCTRYCVLNMSSCTRPVCGNNIKEAYELCDGNDLNNKTCRRFGFPIGTLKCVNCKFNTTSCVKTCSLDSECGLRFCAGVKVRETCENGRCVFKSNCSDVRCAKEGEYTSGTVSPEYQYSCCEGLKGFYPNPTLVGGGALCYNPEKGTPVCRKQGTVEGWYYPKTGTLLKYDNCRAISTWSVTCTDSDNGKDYAVLGKCSRVNKSQTIGTSEAGVIIDSCVDAKTLKECYCENTELKTIDYACPSDCSNGACVRFIGCGDGIISPGEECDGTLFNGMTCAAFNFSGTIGCSNCKLNLSKCTPAMPCSTYVDCPQLAVPSASYRECNGNAVCKITGGYSCLNNSCVLNKGYYECSPCPSGCQNGACLPPVNYCGDGFVNNNEECDFNVSGSISCQDRQLGSFGYLTCTMECKFDTSGCRDSQTSATVSFNPSNANVISGDTVTFDIQVSAVTDLFGYQFDIGYDPAVLGFVSFGDGTFLQGTSSQAPFCTTPAASSGVLDDVACTRLGPIGGVSGSGVLKKITFRALVRGASDIRFSNVKLVDAASVTITTQVASGQVSVSSPDYVCVENWVCDAWSTCSGGIETRTCTDSNACGTEEEKPLFTRTCTVVDYCGDMVINAAGEECDGTSFDGNTCISMGYAGGNLSCTHGCLIDTTGCTWPPSICGDGIVSKPNDLGVNEQCDGVVVGMGCPPEYYGGSVLCSDVCTYDYSNCSTIQPPRCGDGAANTENEQCDGGNLRGESCVSRGFTRGDLACGDNCMFDETYCSTDTPPRCGDNFVNQDFEYCDGTDLNGNSCESRGFVSGTLRCTGSCAFDTRACSMCNNNGVCQPRIGETVENCAGDCVFSPVGVALFTNPGAIDVSVGETVTLDISVSSISDLYGYQFNIEYNPGVLGFVSLADGTFLTGTSTQPFCMAPAATSGVLSNIACTRTGAVGGVSGTGLLKRITFRTLASGTSNVAISNAKLVNSASNTITTQVMSGQISVS